MIKAIRKRKQIRKISWGKNKKTAIQKQYNGFIILLAPLTEERCNYNAMIEYVTIKKIKS